MLRPEDQLLFRRLAVFVGGFTLPAAKAVGNPPGDLDLDVLDSLAALVDQSLVRQLEQTNGEQRFGMLETIHEYALEQLAASGATESVCYRHATYFLALAEATEADLQEPATQKQAIARLQADIRQPARGYRLGRRAAPLGLDASSHLAAQSARLPSPTRPEIGLRLAGALSWFGLIGEQVAAVRRWLVAALQQTHGPDYARAKALWGAGLLAMVQGDYAIAHDELSQSSEFHRKLGDPVGIARSLRELCITAYAQHDLAASQRYGEESVALFRLTAGKTAGKAELALALDNLAATYASLGESATARRLFEEEYALSLALHDLSGLALAHLGLGLLACQDDEAVAVAHLDQALAMRARDRRAVEAYFHAEPAGPARPAPGGLGTRRQPLSRGFVAGRRRWRQSRSSPHNPTNWIACICPGPASKCCALVGGCRTVWQRQRRFGVAHARQSFRTCAVDHSPAHAAGAACVYHLLGGGAGHAPGTGNCPCPAGSGHAAGPGCAS